MLCLLLIAAPAAAGAQSGARLEGSPTSAGGGSPAATTATASRLMEPLVIDGRDDDAGWKRAAVIDGFRTFQPVANGEPRFRTEARIVYDERNLYVLVRMFDPHPDSIVNLMSRRDVRTQSDWIKIMLDPYHDRRSGFEFAVNPGGVKRDFAIVNDGEEDASWDAVWDVGTRIDSLGWVAEFRIPLNQLRYQNATDHTFGIMIWRDVARHNERYSWPVYERNTFGLSSKFGDVTGINGIVSPRRAEFAPYTVARSYNAPKGADFIQKNDARFGADMKYGITSNLTIDATVNPDFGQVEADPSQVNLSGFETFFGERRPFFLEGQGLFRFDVNCNDGSCSGLFYSRRIGRSPQLGGRYYDQNNPTSSTILGAGKLTGRLANGITLGILNAVTQREVGARSSTGVLQTIEPQANYLVGRAGKDFRSGASALGAMFTSVNRKTDSFTDPFLRKSAVTGGFDGRHQFHNREYQVSAYVAGSRVSGSEAAIRSTQMSTVHNFQRPDDDRTLSVDPTRTSLTGYSAQVSIEKRAGGRSLGSAGFQAISPGFELNDVGFLSKAGTRTQWAWFQYKWKNPTTLYRQGNINFNQWTGWTWDNLRAGLGGNINSHWEMPNSMWLHFGSGINAAAESYCDDCQRGGPAVRNDPSHFGWAGIEGDPRRVVVPYLFGNWSGRFDGRGQGWGIDPSMNFRIGSALNGSLGYSYFQSTSPRQFAGNFGVIGNDTTHYTVARIDQSNRSFTARLSYTVTPTLSVEVFGRPFSFHGDYSNWLEVADARAAKWTDRYRPYGGGDPGAQDFKQYRSNTVVRWEYRPGSTLYFVWAQERTIDINDPARARAAPRGLGELKKVHPNNVFLVKGSYWFSM
jgi:hypothetical protein